MTSPIEFKTATNVVPVERGAFLLPWGPKFGTADDWRCWPGAKVKLIASHFTLLRRWVYYIGDQIATEPATQRRNNSSTAGGKSRSRGLAEAVGRRSTLGRAYNDCKKKCLESIPCTMEMTHSVCLLNVSQFDKRHCK